jgi:gliding motility-associated protein GldM
MGGGGSPRQKMINMMYLVLTALLALNVASDLLASIQIIADSLKNSAKVLAEKNDNLNAAIEDAVKKELSQGNNKNQYLIDLGKEIRNKTNEAVKLLETHIDALFKENIAGTNPEILKTEGKKILMKADEAEQNYRYWMGVDDTKNGGRGEGEAKKLREQMLAYVDWANQKYFELLDKKDQEKPDAKNHFKYFCLDPKDDPNVPKNPPDMKSKPWEYYTFHRSPAVANLAILEKMKNDVLVIEAALLELAKGKLKDVTFKIDKLVAFAAPSSKMVVAGMPFEAKLFVTISASQDMSPQYSGPGIKKEKDGTATLRLIADARNVPEGKMEGIQRYSAKITVPKANGTTEVLDVKGDFTVVKPVIKIESAAIKIMYKDCGNDIEVTCPALGNQFNPEFDAKGAKAMQSKTKNTKVRIVPSANECQLIVYQKDGNNKFEIGSEKFRVIPPPVPRVEVLVDGKPYDGKSNVGKSQKITVMVEPDKDFAAALPEDARYQIKGIKLYYKSGLEDPKLIQTLKASEPAPKPKITFDIMRYVEKPERGAVFIWAVEAIERVNFMKQNVPEPLKESNMTTKVTVE